MDPAQFFTAPPLTIVAGKGGVGKTTVSAVLARAATLVGLSALIIEVEGSTGLRTLFEAPELGYGETILIPEDRPAGTGELRARTITSDEALVEYLVDHGLKRISNRLAQSGALDMVATATPGIKDVLVLGKVKQLQRAGAADVIIVDAHAAGHAITFLRSAKGLLDAVRVGPIESQAREVADLLTDATRCQVMLVSLAEETPVNEVVETAYSLEDQVGVSLGPIVVNGVLQERPGLRTDIDIAAAEARISLPDEVRSQAVRAVEFETTRRALQIGQIDRLSRELPLPQIQLPYRFRSTLVRSDVEVLAAELLERIADLVPVRDSA